jgi:hypothetical protein
MAQLFGIGKGRRNFVGFGLVGHSRERRGRMRRGLGIGEVNVTNLSCRRKRAGIGRRRGGSVWKGKV